MSTHLQEKTISLLRPSNFLAFNWNELVSHLSQFSDFPCCVLSNEFVASLHVSTTGVDKLWYGWLYIQPYNQSICDRICGKRSYSLFKVLVLTFHNFKANWPIFLKLHQYIATVKPHLAATSVVKPPHYSGHIWKVPTCFSYYLID